MEERKDGRVGGRVGMQERRKVQRYEGTTDGKDGRQEGRKVWQMEWGG